VGITGLIGAGGTAVLRAIFGADRLVGGRIYLDGQSVVISSPQDAISRGIGLLTEDRQLQGLVLDMSAQDNMTLAALDSAWPGPFIDHAAEHALVNRYALRLGIKPEILNQKTLFLSGGTQQKVVLSKWLATHSRILLFDEPTQGVDIGSRVEIYRLMNDLAHKGTGIIVVSSDVSEILGMCDKIIVLRKGRVAATLPRPTATPQMILAYANGGGFR
jgi:ribose transport system ATP-binding protein